MNKRSGREAQGITTGEGAAIIAENVSGLTIDNVKTFRPVQGRPAIDLNNVQDVFLYNCNPVKGTDVFLYLKGKDTKQVSLKGNNFKYAMKPVVKDETVKENIVVE